MNLGPKKKRNATFSDKNGALQQPKRGQPELRKALTQTGPVRHSVQCQVQEPRSGVGIHPRVSEAEPWVTGTVDASPGGAQERGANMTADPPFADTQGNDPWIRAPTEGSSYALFRAPILGPVTQGSAALTLG